MKVGNIEVALWTIGALLIVLFLGVLGWQEFSAGIKLMRS